jgi:ketosteroid isomerase-like protein
VVVSGHADIRAALGQLLALESEMEATTIQVLRSGDIALVVNEWRMTGTAPDGTEVRPHVVADRIRAVLRSGRLAVLGAPDELGPTKGHRR